MSDAKREPLLPWIGAIGLGVALLGGIALANGNPAAFVAVLAGAAMVAVGLVQKSTRARKRQHDELMAEMRRQRAE